MTSMITKTIAKKILKEHAGNQQGASDPYFEYVAATDMNGNATGKTIKRKRACPPGLTKKEEKTLKKVTRRAYRLDNAFNFCGIKVGWGSIIGFIPIIGDFFDTIMAMMVFRTCMAADLPKTLQSKMTFNIVLDFLIGLVPVLGDFGDMLWRANTKNAALLYEHLEKRGAERLRRGENPDGDYNRDTSPARGNGQGGVISQQPETKQQMSGSKSERHGNVQQPEPARTKTGSLLDRYNPLASRQRDADLENAEGGYRQENHAMQEVGRQQGGRQDYGRQETGRQETGRKSSRR